MVSQLAQLTSVDALNALNGSFRDVLALQRMLSGTELIGKQVEYARDGLLVQGTVESVLNKSDSVKLVVDGLELDLDQVRRIFSGTGG
jgi:flagellar hook assembly protein FlgD